MSIRWGRDNGGRGTVALLLPWMLLAAACGAPRNARVDTPSELGWPQDDPRIRLLRLIDLGEGERSALSKWIGEPDSPRSFERPYAVAWDAESLLVADPETRRIARIDPNGRVALGPDSLFVQPIGLAVCAEGIVVSDSEAGHVALLNGDLRLVRWLARDLARPTGVACAGNRVFVAETGEHRVVILEPDGSTRHLGVRGSGPGEFNFPTSLALDGDALLVGDAMNFRVQRFDSRTGRFLGSFGRLGDAPGELPRLKGIAVDRAGHLWVADAYLDRVLVFDRDGTFLIGIGGAGSGPGDFSFPAGIAAHTDGRIAVVDSLNRRLKIFRVTAAHVEPEA